MEKITRSALLPNLLTIANGICGFAAIVRLGKIDVVDGHLLNAENFTIAAYLILLGMVFDVFDGKLARTFGGGSELGAQLDSLCDLITFGLAPAFMVIRLHLTEDPGWQRLVWFFALVYFLGALLRLARFNVENSPDENAHLAFKGLPSPAAAGCIASLVLFLRYVFKADAAELQWLLGHSGGFEIRPVLQRTATIAADAVAFLAPVLGFTMVSGSLRFAHMGSKLLARRETFDFLVVMVFGAALLAIAPEIVLPLAFLGYFAWTPIVFLWRLVWPSESASRKTATSSGSGSSGEGGSGYGGSGYGGSGYDGG